MVLAKSGFTLLELLLVLSILGLLLLSFPRLDPSRQRVAQAARALAEGVVRARLEAIRENAFAGIQFDPTGAGGYTVFVDKDGNRQYDGVEEVQLVQFGQGDWTGVRLLSPTDPATLLFDPLGIPQGFGGLTKPPFVDAPVFKPGLLSRKGNTKRKRKPLAER